MADGALHSLHLIPETTYGETPTSGDWQKQRITGTTLALTKNTLQSAEIRDDRFPGDTRLGTRQVGGDIKGELSYGTWDAVLEALFGGTWVGNVLKGGTKRRSFSALRTFTDMQQGEKNKHLFTGVEFNTLALGVKADAIITSDFGVIGHDMSMSATMPTGFNEIVATSTKVLDSFTGTLTENGNPLAVITEISLNIDNGIETRFVVGSKLSIRPSIRRFNVTGQVTAYFETNSLLQKFIDETETAIEFTLPDLEGNEYTFTIPAVIYTGGQPDVNDDGPITLSMPFSANYDETSLTNLQITRAPLVPAPTLTGFTLDSSNDWMAPGGGARVTPTAPQPNGAQFTKVTYTSSDPAKATVSNEGEVTAKAAGDVTITATDTLSGGSTVQATKQLHVSTHALEVEKWASDTVYGMDPSHGTLTPATESGASTVAVQAVEFRTSGSVRVTLDNGAAPYASITLSYNGQDYTLPKSGSNNYYEKNDQTLVNALVAAVVNSQIQPISLAGVGTA